MWSIFSISNTESNFEPSYSSIKNSAGEDEDENEGENDEYEEKMEMEFDPILLEDKKKMIIDEVHRKRIMM